VSRKSTRTGTLSPQRRQGRVAVLCTRPGTLPAELKIRISDFAAGLQLTIKHEGSYRRAGGILFTTRQCRNSRGKKRTMRLSVVRRTELLIAEFAPQIELTLVHPAPELDDLPAEAAFAAA
jgi:hypothetical protein